MSDYSFFSRSACTPLTSDLLLTYSRSSNCADLRISVWTLEPFLILPSTTRTIGTLPLYGCPLVPPYITFGNPSWSLLSILEKTKAIQKVVSVRLQLMVLKKSSTQSFSERYPLLLKQYSCVAKFGERKSICNNKLTSQLLFLVSFVASRKV